MPEERAQSWGGREAESAGMDPSQPGRRQGKWLRQGGWGRKQINTVVETIIIKRRVIKVKNGDCVTPKTNRNKRPVDPLYRCLALRDDRLKMPRRFKG